MKIVHKLINIMVCSNGCHGVEKRNLVIKWSKLIQLDVQISFLTIMALFVQKLVHSWCRVANLGSKNVILAQKRMVHCTVTIMIGTPSWCFSVILWYRLPKYALWKKSVTCYNFMLEHIGTLAQKTGLKIMRPCF